ncbi:hypothetical protein H310_12245 [Aphanomyces invadans]|uniref:Hexose transporter 1 n=1 Tax=Aphanomyces invadans TaxID=157072 RepID=A0A024TJZ3_9STRA|nr:hypothetical protein H310_12245 [Aphanomyces invadans]ETV93901.1 hypothetical protein H310_12245 [Aphanomyces invadans]|eukprot:XP_008877461.1 hypothetical protein H310_12245 [Aphanomyces invadans]
MLPGLRTNLQVDVAAVNDVTTEKAHATVIKGSYLNLPDQTAKMLAESPLIPSGKLYQSAFVVLLGAFQYGYLLAQMAWIGFNSKACYVPPAVAKQIPPLQGQCILFPTHTSQEWTTAVTAWIVGAGVGALFSGIPADSLGRRTTLMLNTFLIIAGAFVQMLSNNILMFTIGRGISGIATGVAIVVGNLYLREVAPVSRRAFFLTLPQIMLSFGGMTVSALHFTVTSEELTWRLLFGAPIVLGLLQLCLFPCMIKSPHHLVMHKRFDHARVALSQLYTQPCDIELHLNAMIVSHEKQAVEAATASKLRLLLSAKYRRQMVVAIVMCLSQQLAGMNAIIAYSNGFFLNIGIRETRISNIIVNFGRFHDMFMAARYLDRFSRRTPLLVGLTVTLLASVGIVFTQEYPGNPVMFNATNYLAIVTVLFFVASYCFSAGSMAWLISNELFPEHMSATANSISTFFTFAAQFLIAVYYPQLMRPTAAGNFAFLIFSGCLVFFIGFVFWFVPNTNNKTSEEVTRLFYDDDKLHTMYLDKYAQNVHDVDAGRKTLETI